MYSNISRREGCDRIECSADRTGMADLIFIHITLPYEVPVKSLSRGRVLGLLRLQKDGSQDTVFTYGPWHVSKLTRHFRIRPLIKLLFKTISQ